MNNTQKQQMTDLMTAAEMLGSQGLDLMDSRSAMIMRAVVSGNEGQQNLQILDFACALEAMGEDANWYKAESAKEFKELLSSTLD